MTKSFHYLCFLTCVLVSVRHRNLSPQEFIIDQFSNPAHSFFFFLKILWCGSSYLKSLLNLLQYCFCHMLWVFFWPQGMWDLSPSTREWTHTPCIGRHSLNHWTTREVPILLTPDAYQMQIKIIHSKKNVEHPLGTRQYTTILNLTIERNKRICLYQPESFICS